MTAHALQTISTPPEAGAPTLGFVRLPHGEGIDLPRYETAGAAGMDLRAAVDADMMIAPGGRALVPTGFVFDIPEGHEGQIRPRSGLALKHGVTCLNTPGTIDWDYRGEVKVLLINHGEANFIVTRGMRIAQLVLAPVVQMRVEERTTTKATDRSAGGFGSTGTE